MPSEEGKIISIQKDIEYMKKSQDRIEIAVNNLANVYVTKEEFKEVKTMMTDLKGQSKWWKLISPILSSALTAIVTFLLIFYLQHLKSL